MMTILLTMLSLGMVPVLSSEASELTRGEVRTGPMLVERFTVKHTGSEGIIRITAVDSACGCAKPTMAKTELSPGESTQVTVTVQTLTQPAGAQSWKTKIRYEHHTTLATTSAELELKLCATLVREISVTPPQIAISTTGRSEQKLTVTDSRAKPLKVLRASATSPMIEAGVKPVSANVTTVDFVIRDDYPAGNSEEFIVLMTDDPTCPELRVPVRIVKRQAGAIVPSPEMASLHFTLGQDEISTLLQLRSPTRGTLRIAAIECDHPAVSTKFAANPAIVNTVRVSVNATKAEGRNGQAMLKIRFETANGETLLVPVQWTIQH
jgi:Protein of unknown function (DUF1573)